MSNSTEVPDLEKQTRASSDHLDNQTTTYGDDDHVVSKVYTSGDNNEYVMIGRTKVLRSELIGAFGGDLQPGIHAGPPRRLANPAPLGLCGFALTTFVLSMFNARAMGVTTPNVVVGLAAFYGGLVQLLAGMWEIALDNTFGGTALSSYGGFWMSFAAINIPWFGIAEAYEDPTELANAVGFFLLGWTIFTFGVLLCTMKSTVAFFSLFFFLEITFLLLTIGEFTAKVGVTRAGGVFGVITAFIAWYNAYAGLATRENSYITAKAIPLPGAQR
ncbi:CYFA0S20e00430g1_1 [Cyberlindnera fabianii]|uniref:Ammonia transport outward protein 2 n=1 Tax=Cyberlindnera fabianii TaxID=36022 RepID=A0A061BFQ4_CYBFA|nr:Ammonia transport outward protein 2 [Cyberlindnera fabianii]CDR45807.1 CYFA0S20e00430g1_1 [Cyberlindnera fabianii]